MNCEVECSEKESKVIPEPQNIITMNNIRGILAKNLNWMLIAHLNINSLGNDSELLFEQVKEMVDVLITLETKLEDSLPVGQLKTPRYAFD